MTPVPSPVIIEPYDPAWPSLFEKEAGLIRSAIADFALNIEHIGSTSVPGLAAKPIIDILIGVRQISDAPLFIPPLVEMGYGYKPEHETEIPERRYLQRRINGMHMVHLHIIESTSFFYRRHIAFRDYLRAHPDTAQEYANMKSKLADKFRNDREAYTNGKTDFVTRVEKLAGIEKGER